MTQFWKGFFTCYAIAAFAVMALGCIERERVKKYPPIFYVGFLGPAWIFIPPVAVLSGALADHEK